MPYRRQRMTPPVRSIKHVVNTDGAVIGGAFATTDIINTVDDPDRSVSNNVANGSKVFAVFLQVEAMLQVSASGVDNIYMIVYKNPGNNVAPPPVDAVGVADTRRYVIHQEMLMVGGNLGTVGTAAIPRTLFKGVIRIPRSYQRMGIDDTLQVVIGHRNGETLQRTDWCLQCIYKEFR